MRFNYPRPDSPLKQRVAIKLAFASTLALTLSANALADFQIEQELERFRQNTSQYMGEPVLKFIQNYTTITEGEDEVSLLVSETPMIGGSLFPKELVDNKDFIDLKNQFHEGWKTSFAELSAQGRAAYLTDDDPKNLVDELRYDKLDQMEANKLLSATLSHSPWSSDYWPIYSGIIAERYADDNFPQGENWEEIVNYVYKNSSCSIDNLSPAEKYDLLVGDSNKTLTHYMLSQGQGYAQAEFDQSKGFFGSKEKVARWMGICHGWAPASYMVKRPTRTVVALAADGKTQINFYPDDIKALVSMLWAQSAPNARFIGGRCNKKNPEIDKETGRVTDQACFDNNPGTWHIAVVNQLGVSKRSFVLNVTPDDTVWNQPMYSYEYTYFNPKTNKPVSKLADAIINIKDPEFDDKFKKYRSPKAKSLVGIAMKLVYIAETAPDHHPHDKESMDRKVAANYLYDLELDAKDVIIGGEWYKRIHPDFMWTQEPKDKALSYGDKVLARKTDKSTWHFKKRNPVPASWREAAIKHSSPYGQPLAKIVEALVDKSNRILGL